MTIGGKKKQISHAGLRVLLPELAGWECTKKKGCSGFPGREGGTRANKQ